VLTPQAWFAHTRRHEHSVALGNGHSDWRRRVHALESARAAKDAVAPLEQLAGREEGVVRALDALLMQIETEARRQSLRDQLDALLRMQRAIQTMALAREGRTGQGRSDADFAAGLADLNVELPRFPGRNQPGALGDAIYQLSGAHLEHLEAANPQAARTDVETALARIRAELTALA